MSSNKNLFYNLYSTNNSTVSSGYTCSSAVDESGTSFDITSNSSGSAGVITDSNANTLSSIDMSKIHSEGLTQYNTETRILQPYSCCLLQGQEYGLACGSYYFVIPKEIAEQEKFPYYVTCNFDIIYNNFCPYTVNCNIKADGTTSIDDAINTVLAKNNIQVAVSFQTLEDDIDNHTYTYLVFLAQKEGYFYYINNLKFDICFQSEDYPDSPFSKDCSDISETIIDLINEYQPRQINDDSDPYKIDCFLYKFLLNNFKDACNQIDILYKTIDYVKQIEEATSDEEWERINNEIQKTIKGTIYFDFINDDKHSYDSENLLKVYNVILSLKDFIDENENYYKNAYWLKEDVHRRIPMMKYPNGAFRGIVLIPDWDSNGSTDLTYRSLWINHVKSQVKLYVPTREHQFLPKIYGVLSNATLMSEEKMFRCDNQQFNKLDSNCGWCNDISDGFEDYKVDCKCPECKDPSINNLDSDFINPLRPSKSIYDEIVYMGQNIYPHKKDIIGIFRYMQYVHENKLWNKVGDAYMIIGKDDDPQSGVKNLPTSLLIYNPNPEPIRIKYMIFS